MPGLPANAVPQMHQVELRGKCPLRAFRQGRASHQEFYVCDEQVHVVIQVLDHQHQDRNSRGTQGYSRDGFRLGRSAPCRFPLLLSDPRVSRHICFCESFPLVDTEDPSPSSHEHECLCVYLLTNPKLWRFNFFWRDEGYRGSGLIEGCLQIETEPNTRVQLRSKRLCGDVRYGIRHAYRCIDMAKNLFCLLIGVAGIEKRLASRAWQQLRRPQTGALCRGAQRCQIDLQARCRRRLPHDR